MTFYTPAPLPPTEVLAAIGARARALRLLRDLQQRELAKRSGTSVLTVGRFEKTGKVSLENALRIAFALGAEAGFARLFEAPRYTTLDEALAQPATPKRTRASRRSPRR